RIELALHDVELLVDLRQAGLRLDEDHAVHAVRHVQRDGHRGAVVDVEAGVERGEGEDGLAAGERHGALRAAARAGDRVQVDVVRHGAGLVVLEMQLDEVTLTNADEAAGDGASEGPHVVRHAVGETHRLLDDVDVDDDLRGVRARDRWRHVWRLGEHGDFLTDDLVARRTNGNDGATTGNGGVGADGVAAV